MYIRYLVFTLLLEHIQEPNRGFFKCVPVTPPLHTALLKVQCSKSAATQSIVYAMYAMFAMHGKNSCLYGQCKGPHKTAYAM